MDAQAIDIRGIFDVTKRAQFEEYFNFTISKKNELSFQEFSRNVGVSRRQWDILREKNVDNKSFKWAID